MNLGWGFPTYPECLTPRDKKIEKSKDQPIDKFKNYKFRDTEIERLNYAKIEISRLL